MLGGMLGSDYASQACSIAGALGVVGERWSLLIVRDVFLGLRRFDELQADLGVARNVLQSRLTRLVEQGVLERKLYQERPARYEYVPTQKARDLWPALHALMQWGDKYYAPNGPPGLVRHSGCGGAVISKLSCAACGAEVTAAELEPRPGPGARDGYPRLVSPTPGP